MANKLQEVRQYSGQRLVFYYSTVMFIFVDHKVRPENLVSLADDQRQTGAIGTKVWNTNADESIVSLETTNSCIEDLLAHEYKPAPLIRIVRGRNGSLLGRKLVVSISHPFALQLNNPESGQLPYS